MFDSLRTYMKKNYLSNPRGDYLEALMEPFRDDILKMLNDPIYRHDALKMRTIGDIEDSFTDEEKVAFLYINEVLRFFSLDGIAELSIRFAAKKPFRSNFEEQYLMLFLETFKDYFEAGYRNGEYNQNHPYVKFVELVSIQRDSFEIELRLRDYECATTEEVKVLPNLFLIVLPYARKANNNLRDKLLKELLE